MRSIQSLVASVRADADLFQVRTHVSTIANVVGQVVTATNNTMSTSSSLRGRVEPVVHNLTVCKSRLISANAESEALREKGRVREFMSRLPPLAFEIARETKDLVQRVEMVDQERERGRGQGPEDYS